MPADLAKRGSIGCGLQDVFPELVSIPRPAACGMKYKVPSGAVVGLCRPAA